MNEGFKFIWLFAAFALFVGSSASASGELDTRLLNSSEDSKSHLHCTDFKKIIDFVHSEHLRFRVEGENGLDRMLGAALPATAQKMRDQGYYYLAARFESSFLQDIQKVDRQNIAQFCEAFPSSTHREFFLKAFVSSLDPFSEFYTLDEMPRRTSVVDGHFVGVGIATMAQDAYIRVTEVVEGGPSSGQLQKDDLISHVDGKPVRGLTAEELRLRIRGELGTVVEFRGIRNKVRFETRVERGHVYQKSVTYKELEQGILQIKIHRFYAHTASMIESILNDRKHAKGVILDLRDNPGGLLQGARDVVDLFVSHGVVVHLRGIYEDQISAIHTGGFTETPMVVLVNERSASASEIVAGALQDYGRAMLVGRPTYGKSCVQNIYESHTALGTDYRGGLKLTTLWYYLPSGRSSGTIRPDVYVAASADDETKEEEKRLQMPYKWPQEIQVTAVAQEGKLKQWISKSAKAFKGISKFEEAGQALLKSILAQSATVEP